MNFNHNNDKKSNSNSNNNNNGSDDPPSSPKMKWKKRHSRGRTAQHNNTAKSTIATHNLANTGNGNSNSDSDSSAKMHSADMHGTGTDTDTDTGTDNFISGNINVNSNNVKKPFPMNIEALNSCINLPAGWEAQIKFANEQRQRLDKLQQRLNSAKTDPNAAMAAAAAINAQHIGTNVPDFPPHANANENSTANANATNTSAASGSGAGSSKGKRKHKIYGPVPPPNSVNISMEDTHFPPSLMDAFHDMDVLSMLQAEVMNHCKFPTNNNQENDASGASASANANANVDNTGGNSSNNDDGKNMQPNARDIFLNIAAQQAYANQYGHLKPKGQSQSGGPAYFTSTAPTSRNATSMNLNSNVNSDINDNSSSSNNDQGSAKGRKRSANASSPTFTSNDNSNTNVNSTSSQGSGNANANAIDAPGNDAEMKALMNMFFEIMGMSYDPNGNQKNGGPESVFAAMDAKRAAGGGVGVGVGVAAGPGAGPSGPDLQAATAFVKENFARMKMSGFPTPGTSQTSSNANATSNSNSNSSANASVNSSSNSKANPTSKGNRKKASSSSSSSNVNMGNVPDMTGNIKTCHVKTNKNGIPTGGTITFQTSMGSAPPLPPNQFFSMMVRGGADAMSSFKMCKAPPGVANLAQNLIPPPPVVWPPGAASAAAAAAAAMASSNCAAPWESPYDDVEGCENEDGSGDLDDDDTDCSIPDLMPMNDPSPTSTFSDNWNEIRKLGKLSADSSNDDDRDRNVTDEPDLSTIAAAQLLREEEEAALARDEDEEKAKRASKKREKKQRKKEKARREAAIKAADASIKKREKSIISWQSRMVTAFTGGEVKKVDALISENPFKEGKRLQLDPDIIEYLDEKVPSHSDEVNESMEWLLNSCVVKNTIAGKGKAWLEARNKLCKFIADMAYPVIFEPKGETKSALHRACFTGDFTFVKMVIGHENSPKDCLDHPCEELGWNTLHYASVGGQSDVVELLLQRGCGVGSCTNPTLTCRADDRRGLTSRGLIETIAANTYSTDVESSGDEFRELVDSSAAEKQEYLKTINALIDRLKAVEKRGYSPLKPTQEIDDDVESVQSEKTVQSKASIEQSKAKRKKKKNKDSQKIDDQPDAAPSIQDKGGVVSDPLVSALISMGFSTEQIDAAVLAFGGTDRVTADDMVLWILERESSGTIQDSSSNSYSAGTSMTATETHQQIYDAEQMQRRAEQQAKKDAEEASRKAVEANAAAERLRAKREEQRRIRREWNNREQLRQHDEAQAKLTDEVQRRNRIEAEKARLVAQKAAEERAAPSVLSQHMGVSPLESFGAGAGQSIASSLPLFPAGLDKASAVDQSAAKAQLLDQSLMLASTPPPGIVLPATSNNSLDARGEQSTLKSPRSNRKNRKSKSQKNENSPTRGRKQPERVTANGPSQVPVLNYVYEEAVPVSYDSNPLNDIRATAREFVPSFSPGLSMPSQSAPPGLGLDKSPQAAVRDTEVISSSSLPSQSTASTDALDLASSILPGYSGRASSSPFPMPDMDMERSVSAHAGILPQSPGPSAVGGLPFMPGMLGRSRSSSNNTGTHDDDDFDSSILNIKLDDASSSSAPLGGSGIWGGAAPSSGRLSSFGFAPLDTANNSFAPLDIASANTGFAPLDSANTSFSSHDFEGNTGDNKKSSGNTNSWGTFGPSTGGSIW